MRFSVPGNPAPKKRPRTVKTKRGGTRTFTPRETANAERSLRDHVHMQMLVEGLKSPLRGPVALALGFYRSDKRRVDLDNLCKTVLDSLNATLFEDDFQITYLKAEKHYDKDNPRTEILVWEVNDA